MATVTFYISPYNVKCFNQGKETPAHSQPCHGRVLMTANSDEVDIRSDPQGLYGDLSVKKR
jgi:hypothetical protein